MNTWIKITPTSLGSLSIKYDEYGTELPVFMKPGRLIKYEGGAIELIGDINTDGGAWGCCSGRRAIVIAYQDLEIPSE